MLASSSRVMRRRVLLVDDELAAPLTAAGRSMRALSRRSYATGTAKSSKRYPSRMASLRSAPTPRFIASSSTGRWAGTTRSTHEQATLLLRSVRQRNESVPIFLMADRAVAGTINAEVATMADELVWLPR